MVHPSCSFFSIFSVVVVYAGEGIFSFLFFFFVSRFSVSFVGHSMALYILNIQVYVYSWRAFTWRSAVCFFQLWFMVLFAWACEMNCFVRHDANSTITTTITTNGKAKQKEKKIYGKYNRAELLLYSTILEPISLLVVLNPGDFLFAVEFNNR